MNIILVLAGSTLFIALVVFGTSSIVLYSQLRTDGLRPRFAMLSVPFYLTTLCDKRTAGGGPSIVYQVVRISQWVLLLSGIIFVVVMGVQSAV
jgi:hypothetical protein